MHLLDLAGPDQVFLEANGYGAGFEVKYCGFSGDSRTSSGLRLGRTDDFSKVVLRPGDHLLIPGAEVRYLMSDEMKRQTGLFDWVRDAHRRGVMLGSICTGAFFLGRAGLLDGRKCTTHWKRTAELQQHFPAARVQENILYTDDGGIFTSAGVTAGIDLALHLLSRLCGEVMAHKVARELVVYARRAGNDAQQSVFLSYRNHIHAGIHRVQDWLLDHPGDKTSLDELAAVACMSTRSLTRIFKTETGVTVHEYRALLRRERLQEFLKNPDLSRPQLARLCGLSSERHLSRLLAEYQA